MTRPLDTRSSRYDSVSIVSTAILYFSSTLTKSALLIVDFLGCGIIDFDWSFRLQGAQSFVTAHHDLIARLQTIGDLNVRDSADAGFHGLEKRFFPVNHEDSLNF